MHNKPISVDLKIILSKRTRSYIDVGMYVYSREEKKNEGQNSFAALAGLDESISDKIWVM